MIQYTYYKKRREVSNQFRVRCMTPTLLIKDGVLFICGIFGGTFGANSRLKKQDKITNFLLKCSNRM